MRLHFYVEVPETICLLTGHVSRLLKLILMVLLERDRLGPWEVSPSFPVLM
jgi:hypothetical protein